MWVDPTDCIPVLRDDDVVAIFYYRSEAEMFASKANETAKNLGKRFEYTVGDYVDLDINVTMRGS